MENKYYVELKEKTLKVEIFNEARDYAKYKNQVKAYFEIGRIIK